MKNKLRRTWIIVPVTALGVAGCAGMFAGTSSTTQPGPQNEGAALSRFTRFQVDPPTEDSAGPQFVASGDLDGDGMLDLTSGWNESQPIQLHLQRRDGDGNVFFQTVQLGGTTPVARIAGLAVQDMDLDGRLDVVVLIKDTGGVAHCDVRRDDCDTTIDGGVIEDAIEGGIMIFFAPQDTVNEPWTGVTLEDSVLAGKDDGGTRPEESGYTGLAVGEIDGLPGPDIVVAFNPAEEDLGGDQFFNRVDLYPNPATATGPEVARIGAAWTPAMIAADLSPIRDVKILDVDRDGDADVLSTYPTAKSLNIRWLPNPLNGGDAGTLLLPWGLPAPVGKIDTEADVMAIADIDNDGVDDVAVRSATGKVVQWFKGPSFPSPDFIRNPWQVFTLVEFTEREPQAIALGDISADGQVDLVASAGSAIVWMDSGGADRVFEQWTATLIHEDATPEELASQDAALADLIAGLGQDESPETAFINTLLIVDLDGDGDNDVIATMDRNGLSGLSNDALLWFRNERGSGG